MNRNTVNIIFKMQNHSCEADGTYGSRFEEVEFRYAKDLLFHLRYERRKLEGMEGFRITPRSSNGFRQTVTHILNSRFYYKCEPFSHGPNFVTVVFRDQRRLFSSVAQLINFTTQLDPLGGPVKLKFSHHPSARFKNRVRFVLKSVFALKEKIKEA